METWLPLFDPRGKVIEGYEVSDRGRVRSYWISGPRIQTNTKPRLRKPSVSKRGNSYVLCTRVAHGKNYTYRLNELVAYAFLGLRPTPRHVLIHLNHDWKDNRAKNLAWVTRSEQSKRDCALRPRRPLAKLTPAIVRAVRASKAPAKELAKKYKVLPRAIYNIRWGRSWREVV